MTNKGQHRKHFIAFFGRVLLLGVLPYYLMGSQATLEDSLVYAWRGLVGIGLVMTFISMILYYQGPGVDRKLAIYDGILFLSLFALLRVLPFSPVVNVFIVSTLALLVLMRVNFFFVKRWAPIGKERKRK